MRSDTGQVTNLSALTGHDYRIDFIKEPKVGDFIIVHAGFAIEKMKEEQALLNLEAISEAANAV